MTEETPIHVAHKMFAISMLDRVSNAEFSLDMRQIALGQATDKNLQQHQSVIFQKEGTGNRQGGGWKGVP